MPAGRAGRSRRWWDAGWASALAVAVAVAAYLVVWAPQLMTAPASRQEAWLLTRVARVAGWLVHAGNALWLGRLACLIAVGLSILAVAVTAVRLWSPVAGLASGLVLAGQASLFPDWHLVSELPWLIAAVGLATMALVHRLESYQSLGGGAALGYTLALVAAVAIEPRVILLVLAHVGYALSMRPNAEGWRQLLGAWVIGAALATVLWIGRPLTLAAPGPAARELLAVLAPDRGWLVVLGVCVLTVLVGVLASAGQAFFDTGLLLAVLLLACGWGWLLLGADARPAVGGLALLAGCAAGQFSWSNLRRLTGLVLVAAISVVSWMTIPEQLPTRYSPDGNPALARDLRAGLASGDYLAFWQPGQRPDLAAAMALATADQPLFAALTKLPSTIADSDAAQPLLRQVSATEAWATQAVPPGSYAGKVALVSLGDRPAGVFTNCTLLSSERYRAANLALLQCPDAGIVQPG